MSNKVHHTKSVAQPITPEDAELIVETIRKMNEDGYGIVEVNDVRKRNDKLHMDLEVIDG